MDKHVIMKHSLAKALLDAGIQHFDTGGIAPGGIGGALNNVLGGTSTYQATAPTITTQNNLTGNANQLYGQNQSIYNNQNTLAAALAKQAAGGGPNPALSQLNATTGQNVNATGALMAGARGAAGNVGLMSREAGQTGAATQQQAAGQAATLAAQQQLQAQQNLQNLYNQQAQAALQGQGIQQGALASQNATETTGQLGAANINANTALNNANNAQSTAGGLLGGVGSVVGGIGKGLGSVLGSIFAEGGDVPFMRYNPNLILADGGAIDGTQGIPNVPGQAAVAGDSTKNDTVPALLSPRETVLPRSVTMAPDAPERAKKFVEALQDKKGKSGGYGKVIKARGTLKERVAKLEQLCNGGQLCRGGQV